MRLCRLSWRLSLSRQLGDLRLRELGPALWGTRFRFCILAALCSYLPDSPSCSCSYASQAQLSGGTSAPLFFLLSGSGFHLAPSPSRVLPSFPSGSRNDASTRCLCRLPPPFPSPVSRLLGWHPGSAFSWARSCGPLLCRLPLARSGPPAACLGRVLSRGCPRLPPSLPGPCVAGFPGSGGVLAP